MTIKLDENLPHQLVQLLTDLGHDVDTVPDEHIAGREGPAAREPDAEHVEIVVGNECRANRPRFESSPASSRRPVTHFRRTAVELTLLPADMGVPRYSTRETAL